MIARRAKEDNTFANLRRQALESIQALSGNKWTDFNAHDPGVTIMEAAHYALLELQYKLDFPLETYLSKNAAKRGKAKSRNDQSALGFFGARAISSPSLVTPSDYEAFFRKQIPELTDCRVSLDNGRYRIQATLSDYSLKNGIGIKIIELYHAHRNSCETLGEIVFEKSIDRPEGEAVLPSDDDAPQFKPKEPDESRKNLFSSEYYSFQNHFPDCYGINEKGFPPQSSPQRKAKALQLKAYLLLYDFLMANALQQAEQVADLLRLPPHLPAGCSPAFTIGDMEMLIDKQRFEDYHFPSREFLEKQKSGVLDTLDRLYGENTEALCEGNVEAGSAAALQKRADLIRFFPQYNANRFRSFNILNDNPKNIPSVLQLVSMVFGKEVTKDIYWVEHILLSAEPDQINRLTIVLHIRLLCLVELDKLESFMLERLPAHLDVRFVRLRHEKMMYFKDFHRSWRKLLFSGDEDNSFFQGDRLLSFLSDNEKGF